MALQAGVICVLLIVCANLANLFLTRALARQKEYAVRMALGAGPGSVTAMIVGQSSIVTLLGIVVGLCSSVATGRLIESLLYGVSPRDTGVLAGTTVMLLLVAVLACWLPARRAARVSPVQALRTN